MNTKKSRIFVNISFGLCYVVFLSLVAMVIFLPALAKLYMNYRSMDSAQKPIILTILYTAVLPAFLADFSLMGLLKDVKSARVFSSLAVKKLNIITLCCFGEVFCFLCLSYYFRFSGLIAFAALFMGVVLSVVAEVIKEAAQIKAENDSTI